MAFQISRRFNSTLASTAAGGASRDSQLSSAPEDSISDLSWSKTANFLAVASWDNKLRIYDVSRSKEGIGKAMINFNGPVMSCSWSNSGEKVVGAGADGTAQLLDLSSNWGPSQQIAVHDAPVRAVRFFDGPSAAPMVVTGSWDKTIRYWDLRTAKPVGSVACQDKVYSMDVQKSLLVVATAEKHFHVIDLNDPMRMFSNPEISQLKFQTRVVCCFPDATGFATGSIEGRCAIRYIHKRSDDNSNFSFKCHRDTSANNDNIDCYSVNCMSFHPIYGTLCTGGSDGTMHIWDKDNKNRTKGFVQLGAPVTSTAFNHDGSILAYALSYDWSKGYAFNTPQHVNKVMLHPVANEEVRPKTRSSYGS